MKELSNKSSGDYERMNQEFAKMNIYQRSIESEEANISESRSNFNSEINDSVGSDLPVQQ